jgi:hypothetical protein
MYGLNTGWGKSSQVQLRLAFPAAKGGRNINVSKFQPQMSWRNIAVVVGKRGVI